MNVAASFAGPRYHAEVEQGSAGIRRYEMNRKKLATAVAEAERIAASLSKAQAKAVMAPGVDGIAMLSDRQVDKMIKLGLIFEYDIPTLGGWANDEAAIEMAKLGLACVAHTWSPLGQAVAAVLRGVGL